MKLKDNKTSLYGGNDFMLILFPDFVSLFHDPSNTGIRFSSERPLSVNSFFHRKGGIVENLAKKAFELALKLKLKRG